MENIFYGKLRHLISGEAGGLAGYLRLSSGITSFQIESGLQLAIVDESRPFHAVIRRVPEGKLKPEKSEAIDWSKAPKDATAHHAEGHGYFEHWLKDGYFCTVGFEEDGWKRDGIPSSRQDLITPRPTVWTGTGLPPVGTVFEVENPHRRGQWSECTILAWDSECAVFVAHGDYPYMYDGSAHPECFRPIRTPEQIAVEEREASAIDLYMTINWNDTRESWDRMSQGRRDDYRKAIDAGYRKFEIVEKE